MNRFNRDRINDESSKQHAYTYFQYLIQTIRKRVARVLAAEFRIFELSKNLFHNMTMNIGEAVATTLKFISKSLVINAE